MNARHWSDDKVLEGRAFFRGESNPGRLVLDTLTAADRSELEHSSGGRVTLAGSSYILSQLQTGQSYIMKQFLAWVTRRMNNCKEVHTPSAKTHRMPKYLPNSKGAT